MSIKSTLYLLNISMLKLPVSMPMLALSSTSTKTTLCIFLCCDEHKSAVFGTRPKLSKLIMMWSYKVQFPTRCLLVSSNPKKPTCVCLHNTRESFQSHEIQASCLNHEVTEHHSSKVKGFTYQQTVQPL